MSLPVKIRRFPVRTAIGAFILNSGLEKRSADEETAKHLHGFAAGAYPVVQNVDSVTFAKALSAGEIAVGAALLLPMVPTMTAGLALTAFSGGLLGLYLRTPGLRKPGSLRPTQDGTAIAKDVWLLGAGLGLVIDALTTRKQ
jgi:hypothetical protein